MEPVALDEVIDLRGGGQCRPEEQRERAVGVLRRRLGGDDEPDRVGVGVDDRAARDDAGGIAGISERVDDVDRHVGPPRFRPEPAERLAGPYREVVDAADDLGAGGPLRARTTIPRPSTMRSRGVAGPGGAADGGGSVGGADRVEVAAGIAAWRVARRAAQP